MSLYIIFHIVAGNEAGPAADGADYVALLRILCECVAPPQIACRNFRRPARRLAASPPRGPPPCAPARRPARFCRCEGARARTHTHTLSCDDWSCRRACARACLCARACVRVRVRVCAALRRGRRLERRGGVSAAGAADMRGRWRLTAGGRGRRRPGS